MKYRICGIENSQFKPKNSEREIDGITLFVLYETKFTKGFRTDRIWVSNNLLKKCKVENLNVDDVINITYNKFGSKESIEIVEE